MTSHFDIQKLMPRKIDYNLYRCGSDRHQYTIMQLSSGWSVFYDYDYKRVCIAMDLPTKEDAEQKYRQDYIERLQKDIAWLKKLSEEETV